MARRKEDRQSDIDISFEVHELKSKLASEEEKTDKTAISTREKPYFKSLVNQILTEELEVDPEVHEIFQEAQEQVLVDRKAVTGKNQKFQLLDDAFTPKNPLCHPEAVEEDYSEESLP